MRRDTPSAATNDTKRRVFTPIHMELVDRLTKEAETLSTHLPDQAKARFADETRIAA